MQPRLTRSRTDRMIGGVCGGLGQYFGVDPVIVRLIFVVLAFTTFITPVVYPVLWLVMPDEGTPQVGAGATMPLPSDARFDPMTGEPLPPRAIDESAQFADAPPPAASSRSRTLGYVLASLGALVLLDQITDALGRLLQIDFGSILIPLLLVGVGIFLLRKQTV